MYIIGDVISHVKKKCELFIKMHIVISGAGTRNLTAGVHKSSKNAKKGKISLDTRAKP
tara:strand:+ start:768 stop:941 length:174 start_codon:yes stop_codon:yes gene_type:complete